MALEVVKTSAYQSNAGSAAQTYDAGGLRNADVNFDLSKPSFNRHATNYRKDEKNPQ